MRSQLLAVLALTVVTSTSAADPLVSPDQPKRLSVEVDADGAGTLRFGPVKDADELGGESITLRSFPTATATKADDGTITLRQPITSADELKSLLMVDGKNQVMAAGDRVTIRSARLPQFSNSSQGVSGVMLIRGRLPLRVAVDLSQCDLPRLAIQLEKITPDGRESLNCYLNNLQNKAEVLSVRRPRGQQLQVKSLASQPLRNELQLAFDVPNPMRDGAVSLMLNATSPEPAATPGTVVIDLVTVGGSVSMMFGAALKPFAGQVGVDRVVPGSIAEAAGLRTGDFITSIDGVDVSTVSEAIAEFNKQTIGSTYEVGIIRGGDAATMTVAVE